MTGEDQRATVTGGERPDWIGPPRVPGREHRIRAQRLFDCQRLAERAPINVAQICSAFGGHAFGDAPLLPLPLEGDRPTAKATCARCGARLTTPLQPREGERYG